MRIQLSLKICALAAAGLLCYPHRQMIAHAQDVHVRVSPDVKTGIEGTTEFPTIQMAMDHHPFAGIGKDGRPGRVYIEIAPGVYHERVIVTQNHTNITLVGTGKTPADVVITNSLNAKQAGGTFFTETVEINGNGFEADNITFENTAGNTGQAVAASVRADKVVFKNCRFLGHQDTLFADYGRQYYVDSYIEGGVDFIFGNAAAVFDHDEIHANGAGYLTAQSRTSPKQTTGYVIIDSKVASGIQQGEAEPGAPPRRDTISLGRPWRPYSRVVYIDTELPADVIPQGWNAWGRTDSTPQTYYAEFHDTGPGANPSGRVAWSHQITAQQAAQYRPRVFLAGKDHWNPIAAAAKLP
ncbi:putative pectinesterase [Candidatus Sulfotelmatomonas gaucii]|uniref:Putative pectinesterase n=1 Tax=Candidatus Sulfuritelmatomonas gaucii TaxID=2043161 RepID=A0A2N9LPA8_9BACT|nr:putative pectinesterase [Candidatus Sulfotelmatomonas gaucii]